MNLRATIAAGGLALACFASATDYELIVPRGWKFLQTAETLVVSDPSGTLKAGDRISRVIPGVAQGGTGLRISAGWFDPTRPVLAKSGSVDGFSGNVILGLPAAPSGLEAQLVPLGTGATAPAEDQGVTSVIKRFPWLWVILGLAGVAGLSTAIGLMKRDRSVGTSPIRYTGRKGIEEGVREIRAKIDEIQEQQRELVRKPPVLRSFRKQFDSYDNRLKKLESAAEETRDFLSGIGAALGKLEERMVSATEQAALSAIDSKRTHELVAKLGADVAMKAGGTEEKLRQLKDELSPVPKAVDVLSERATSIEKRIDGLGKQVESSEQALKPVLAGLAEVKAGLGQVQGVADTGAAALDALTARLSVVPEALAKTEQRLEVIESRSEVAAQGQEATARRLNSLEEQGAAGNQQIEEALLRLDGLRANSELLAKGHEESVKRLVSLEERGVAGSKQSEETLRRLTSLEEGSNHAATEAGDLAQRIASLAEAFGNVATVVTDLQSRMGTQTQANEGLHAGIRELRGKLEGLSEGLAERTNALAIELGALGSLLTPLAGMAESVSSLGERVGSLDTLLTPMSERGDLLAESFRGLQDRVESASATLANQVERMESRLEDLRAEGSRLAGLPEVATALHGNTAELADHVRGAEVGLRGLGEELARLQEGLRHGNRHSESLAEDITKRMEAWEKSLSQVATRVEELKTEPPVLVEIEAPKKQAKKSQPVEPDQEMIEEPVEEVVLELIETEEADIEPAVAVEEPLLEVIEAVQEHEPEAIEVEAEPVAEVVVEESELETEVEAAAESLEPAAAAMEIEDEQPASEPVISIDEDFEDEGEGISLDRAREGRWFGLGGCAERTWSVKVAEWRDLRQAKGAIRPATPIETPGIDGPVGALICTAQGAAYSHGDTLKSYWPGEESRGVLLESPLPSDLWRLMMFAGYLYCVEERQVEVIHVGTWKRHSHFHGDYSGQVHTDSHWVGLMSWGGQLAVDFRDTLGNHYGKPRALDAPATQATYLAASGSSVYVATRSGIVYRVDTQEAAKLSEPNEQNPILSMSIVKAGPLLTIQAENGILLRQLNRNGAVTAEGDPECPVLAHAPVIVGDRYYLFDDCRAELVIGNLKTLQVTHRMPIQGVSGVRRMIAMSAGKNHLLGMLATDDRGNYVRALAFDPKTEQQLTLSNLNQPTVDIVAGHGKFVVSASAAYQNTIQVFEPFDAAEGKLRQAA